MLLKYFYDERLAQASYLVGCQQTGEAIVIDPARDVRPYLEAARQAGLRITHVTETHIHADFVSGSRDLAAQSGATIYLSDMGGADWKYAYAHEANVALLHDNDTFMVGNVRFRVMHTPGHTPEHISFVLTDTAGADEPLGIFTGDFLFVGDVGRPDLLEVAAGQQGTKEAGARQQFANVQKLKSLPDYLQIWPGHGAGSACGKALGALPSTTLGYEKRFNPAFQIEQEEEFVRWLLAGQPEPPHYFSRMKLINKQGPALLHELAEPQQLDTHRLEALLAEQAQIIDLRPLPASTQAAVSGTVSIPADRASFVTFVGWLVRYDQPTYLIVSDSTELGRLLPALRSIGVDAIAGYWDEQAIQPLVEPFPVLSAEAFARRRAQEPLLLLDVRNNGEFQQQHLLDAYHIPLGRLLEHLEALPRTQPIVTQCASGYRAHIAASLLRAHGLTNVMASQESFDAWARAVPLA
ncbi:hydroxyacylglutathione hydrolase [Thermosporothrix hazakensis]|jgi:hydroxyacylglutathione hydrolase|uniref:Hydroxyacylglutathione hydrolase n=1 Tax=Thermosporothrix hazakensis TaxID=644383 RepID=A0A326UFA4_THEHA|nr:MBL fold metallo-hydrolase [Thermosporothrix hazakensis]PZW29293.1 hydroxyacylglutathione hydrolase [Thermosporothrix hazakensis]GCE45354.1 Zn-dependent hydrolase [Thermosporothrix hazakensis]